MDWVDGKAEICGERCEILQLEGNSFEGRILKVIKVGFLMTIFFWSQSFFCVEVNFFGRPLTHPLWIQLRRFPRVKDRLRSLFQFS